MYMLNNFILLANSLIMIIGAIVFLATALKFRSFTLKKIKTEKKMLAAELRKRIKNNVFSLDFNEAYNVELNKLLDNLKHE